MQREAKYVADLARADFVVVNDQSNFAYQYFKGRNYQNGDISPFNRELTYCEDEPLTGLDIMIIQRGMQAIGYFEPDENYKYGTYDLDTFNAAFNNNVLWGIGREIFDESSYRVIFNSENRSQRTPQWLLDLQEYTRQHRITQYAVAARTLGKIEVPINGGGPSGKFAGRADVFRERSRYSEIWEIKHSNPRNIQVGDRQLQRYCDAAENKPQKFMTPLLRGYDFQTFYVPYDSESCLEISSTSMRGVVFYKQIPIPTPEPEYAPVPFPESQKEYELALKPIPIGTVLAVSISIVCIAGGIYILAATGDPVPLEEGLRDLGRVLGYA